MTQPNATDEFLALRAEWKAAGRPSDHEYMDQCRAAQDTPMAPVTPLVGPFTAEMVEAAGRFGFAEQSAANVKAMMTRGMGGR